MAGEDEEVREVNIPIGVQVEGGVESRLARRTGVVRREGQKVREVDQAVGPDGAHAIHDVGVGAERDAPVRCLPNDVKPALAEEGRDL